MQNTILSNHFQMFPKYYSLNYGPKHPLATNTVQFVTNLKNKVITKVKLAKTAVKFKTNFVFGYIFNLPDNEHLLTITDVHLVECHYTQAQLLVAGLVSFYISIFFLFAKEIKTNSLILSLCFVASAFLFVQSQFQYINKLISNLLGNNYSNYIPASLFLAVFTIVISIILTICFSTEI
jgi:hypothetical protein